MKICNKMSHVLVRKSIRKVAAQFFSQEVIVNDQFTALNLEKMHADNLAFCEMIFGIPTHMFEHIMLYKSDKDIWDIN